MLGPSTLSQVAKGIEVNAVAQAPMQIVVSSINHDGQSLLSPIQDAYEQAIRYYGKQSLRRPELNESSILEQLRDFEQVIQFLSSQMSAVTRGFELNQNSNATLEVIRGIVLQSSATLENKAEALLGKAHELELTDTGSPFHMLIPSCSDLVSYVDKLLDIGDKIVATREEKVSLEREFRRALEDVRKKYFQVDYLQRGRLQSSLYVNRGTIYLLFRELLTNSFKYRETGRRLEISRNDSSDKDIIKISVGDNGIGIDPVHCEEAIYKAGFRVDNFKIDPEKKRGPPPGQGVGLSIVKSIVDNLHGTVEAKSVIGEGTQIYLTFPKAHNIAGRVLA